MSLTRTTTASRFSQFGMMDMKLLCAKRWFQITVLVALLLGLGGWLGANAGFFISSSVANASIFALVKRVGSV